MKLKLVQRPDSIDGYWYRDVNEFMKEKGLTKEWNEWFQGQVGTMIENPKDGGKLGFLVYKYDVDRFLKGVDHARK